MSINESYVDYSMDVDQSVRRRECDNCVGMGNSQAVQVTRKADGFLIYCFRCVKSYFIPDGNASPSQVKTMYKQRTKKKFDSKPVVVKLPEDFTEKLPPLALVDLYDYEVTDKDIKWFRVGWSNEHQRIIFPLYKYGKFDSETGWAVKLTGWAGKKLSSDDNKDKPKWSIVRQRDTKHVRFIAVPDGWMASSHTIVLVEDPISAMRVSDAGFLTIALLTTYLPDEMITLLKRGPREDPAWDKAVKYMGKLGANGVPSKVIHTNKDPKAYGQDRIYQEVMNAK